MRLQRYRQLYATIFSTVIATTTIHPILADPVDPLGFSEALDFFPALRREVICPANYFSCEDKGVQFTNTCCENGQVCSLDAYQSAACCPTT
jgi:hypothetical protein